MARKTSRQLIRELLAKHEKVVRDAFLEAVSDITNSATLRVIVERLERGDIIGAVEAVRVEPEAFGVLERAIADAYYDGGQAQIGNWPVVREPDGSQVIWRFGVRDPVVEAWLRDHSSQLITRTTQDMREAIRETLSEGLAHGRNPTRTALDVVGRVSRATNRRAGGIVGLTAPQARAVENARQRLLLGDPAIMREVLGLKRRDRRFDRTILKAIRECKPLSQDFITRWAGRYSDGLLKWRGDLIGLNETNAALARSKEDAIRQQIEAGKLDAQDVVKVWRHTPQESPRLHHRAMNGKSVPYGEKFELPNGVRMDHPHSDDAPISETAFCKCHHALKVDFFASAERRFRGRAA